MKTGTCYFPSYGAAMRYYRPYVEPADAGRAPGQTVPEWRKTFACRSARHESVRQLVDEKLNSGEIHIGKPVLKPGQTLTIEDNRYHITER